MVPSRASAVGFPAALAVGAGVIAAVPLRVHATGLEDIANHPMVVVPMAMASVVVLSSSRFVADPATRRLVGGAGLALFAYLLVTAALAWYGGDLGHRDAVTETLMAVQALGWVPPITLMTSAYVSALVAVGAVGPRAWRWLGVVAVYTTVAFGLVLMTTSPPSDTPYAGMEPLIDAPRLATTASVLPIPWLALVVLAPAVAWWAVAKSSGPTRPRAVMIALTSLVTPLTIVYCLAATVLSYVAGVLSVSYGAITLSIAFHLPFVVAAPALARALGEPPPALPSERTLRKLLTVGVGLPLLIVAVTVGWLAADRLDARGAAFAVLTVLALGAAAASLRRRVVAMMVRLIDPARARTADAMRTLVGRSPAAVLQEVSRRALRDDAVTVSLLLPHGLWVYADGSAAPVPALPATERAHLEPALPDSWSVLDEASPLIDRAVLELSALAQETALDIARAEAEEARSSERRRLERDLHDGVQGRLLALALDLRISQRTLPDGEAHLVIADAVESLGRAIDELRTLSHGDGPAVLSRHGLRAALTDFTGRLPLDVTLTRAPERLPPEAESVVYLVVCEAVTNAVKHARAESVEIDVDMVDDVAVVRVTDDGVGGADLRAGTGLRGLAERVAGLGGRLMVSDRSPSGTLLEVTLRCGS